MAISTELLNSTFEDFRGPLVMGWQQNVPLRAMLMKKGKVSSEGGKYVERPLMTGAPARGVGIFNGDEVLDRTRYKKLKRLRVDFHRIVVSINIPNKELKQNTGKAAALSLINEYPKVVIEGIGVDREKYLLTGKSTSFVMDAAELYGYATLNGQFTAGVGTGVEHGFLDFESPTAQAASAQPVENIAKSTADYHYNQYGDIGTWATDGINVFRKVYRTCAQFSGKPNGGPDIVILDDDTYGNYQSSKADVVRTMKVSDNIDKSNLITDVFGLAGVYPSQLIDLANDFTGVAMDGVGYFLNTDHIEIIQLEKPNVTPFRDASNDQDGVTAKYAEHEAMIFTKFPAHGCISGGAT